VRPRRRVCDQEGECETEKESVRPRRRVCDREGECATEKESMRPRRRVLDREGECETEKESVRFLSFTFIFFYNLILAIFWAKYDENRHNFLSLKCGKDFAEKIDKIRLLKGKNVKLENLRQKKTILNLLRQFFEFL
jgi:hypothetical protein